MSGLGAFAGNIRRANLWQHRQDGKAGINCRTAGGGGGFGGMLGLPRTHCGQKVMLDVLWSNSAICCGKPFEEHVRSSGLPKAGLSKKVMIASGNLD
jgi:hypothetical protein